ncbi:MAG: hypothetical protein LBH00_11885 [Planctomycetaceae bacterium]|jgi:hypothetical protein|nr:hypothetical protein [Planctomycetaceae bacterium]
MKNETQNTLSDILTISDGFSANLSFFGKRIADRDFDGHQKELFDRKGLP